MLGDLRILRKLPDVYATPTSVNSTPYALLISDTDVYVDATASPIIVTLPPATGSGRKINIKKVDLSSNMVIVTADITGIPDLIDGDATFPLVYPWASITLQDWATDVWGVQ